MSISTIQTGVTHSAIMAWRDEAALTAMALVHDAAAGAMQVWNEWPSDNTVPNTIGAHMSGWIVRAAMRRSINGPIHKWAANQEMSLESIDQRLRKVANVFRHIDGIVSIPVNEEPDHKDLPGLKWSAATLLIGFTPLRWVPAARNQISEASRRACLVELNRSWLNPFSGSEPSSYLAQLLNLVDRTAREAKEVMK